MIYTRSILDDCRENLNMRCKCCDKRLSDAEASSKDKLTGEFYDMCRKCREWSLGNITSNPNAISTKEEDLDFVNTYFGEYRNLFKRNY